MQTISSVDLADRLRPVIARLARRVRQQGTGELSPSQNAALVTIEQHGPLTPSDLAARERITRPTATGVLGRLEERALIARVPDAADRRCSRVSITPAGAALLVELRARRGAYLARSFDRLSAAELAVLDEAAAILERVLEEDDA